MRTIFYFHAFRLFSPIIPFITPYFVEEKNISNKKFHSIIIPFFFVSSFISGLIGPFLVSWFGEKKILITESILECLFLTAFHFIPEGQIKYLIFITCMHGASTSLSIVTKKILYADGGKREKIISNFNTLKRVSSVMSGLIGQDLYFSSGEHTPSLIMSIITSIIASLISFFVTPVKEIITSKKTELFSQRHVFFCLLYIVGSTIYIAFSVYSASIFIERKKNTNLGTYRFGRFLYSILMPLRLISFIFLKFLSLFMNVDFKSKYDNEKLIFGYIDGLSKVAAVLFSYPITSRKYSTEFLAILTLFMVIPTITITFYMGKVKNLLTTYILYLVGMTSSFCILTLTHVGFNQCIRMEILVGINLTVASFIHISINMYGRYKKLSAQEKMRFYLFSSLVLYVSAIFVWIFAGRFVKI